MWLDAIQSQWHVQVPGIEVAKEAESQDLLHDICIDS